MNAAASTLQSGYVMVVLAMVLTVVVVILSRRLDIQGTLHGNTDLIANVYPIIGLVYGVFLGFTIVITWGHYQDAEASVMEEVTRVSELWRDAEPFPDSVRDDIQDRLFTYVTAVVESDWEHMALYERHSPQADSAYGRIWEAYYEYDPVSDVQAAFFAVSLGELNEFGRARRQRSLYASTGVQPLIRLFLLGGGVMTVLFSLLIPAKSVTVQAVATTIMSGLIAYSIFIALSLERPFSGDVSLGPTAFEEIIESFESRSGGRLLRSDFIPDS